MDLFQKGALKAFEDDMVIHLAEFSPPLFKAIKEEQLRKAIRFGMQHANEEYEVNFKGPVRLYLELMLLLGSHFDTDPQYPWANEILTNTDLDQTVRAEHLYNSIKEYRSKVNGPKDKYTLEGLENMATFARQPLVIEDKSFIKDVLDQMKLIYPQKAKYVRDEQNRVLIRSGIEAAHKYDITNLRAKVLMIILMSAFGHGCCDDPLYVWIANTLTDERITSSDARAKRLENKAATWLNHVLNYFNKLN